MPAFARRVNRGGGRQSLLAPSIDLAARQLATSQVDARLATIAHETLDGARVPFRPLTLVEPVVAHAALGAGIGNGEPRLLAQTEQLKRLVR